MNRPFQGILGLLAVSILLFSCGTKKAKPTGPVPVNLYTAQLEHAVYYDEYPGNVVGLSQVDLHAEVEGYITGIFFKEGDHVKAGQQLYEIDRSKYMASYNQAQAGVQVAQANLDQAQKDADRYEYLNQHDAIAKQTLDHAMTTLQNAKNQVKSAKEDLVKAQTDLKYSIITAPFSGTIGLSQVKLGTLVNPGQTVLNTISTDDPMAVDFVINEKELPRYIKLQKQPARPADSLFTILMPDKSQYPYPGNISVIDRGVDPQTGTIKVRLVFPNSDFQLRAGMSCVVHVRNDDTALQLLIPARAIVEQMGEYFIYVAKDTVINNPDTKDKSANANKPALVAVQHKVKLGQTIGDSVIVKNGLNAGEQVVIDGVQKLKDGAPITAGGQPGTQAGKQ